MEGRNVMTFALNLIILTMIVVIAILVIYYIFKNDINEEEVKRNDYSIDALSQEIKETFHNIVNTNIAELGLNQTETLKRERQKIRLSKALRNCSFGDTGEKDFVKDYMKDLLQRFFHINENTIDLVIKFSEEDQLCIQDKFEILLYIYKKNYGGDAFEKLCEINRIQIEKEREDGIYYEITKEDIEQAFLKVNQKLTYVDKLEIVVQRIYQQYRGLGVVDELRDQACLDGVSGGVSGISNRDYNYLEEILHEELQKGIFRHDSVWIFLRGKSIHLSFLSFGSKRELERVCKNVYRYDAPYYLSGIKGKVVAEDKKGNRITVARPPFADNWKFFIRKFESVKHLVIEDLITDEGCELAITTMKYIIMGCMVVVITGNQAVGKTTILKALVRFIDPTLNIRVEEDVFETWLNKIYPGRNINTFRKTDSISMEEGMDFQKKTDGDVMILGEVAEQKVAALLIQLSQFTRQTICTNHSATTDKLIEYFRNAGLAMNIFNSESVAEEQVANAIRWDIHCKRSRDGHRYIERITEIIPNEDEDFPDGIRLKEGMLLYFKKMTRRKRYETKDIIVFENGHYIVKNMISESSLNKIRENISGKDLQEFIEFYNEKFRYVDTQTECEKSLQKEV